MLSRCEDKDHAQWGDYGGRGIYVSEEWHDFKNFYQWCVDNGVKAGLQVDRIDNSGPYSPENCRVVTRSGNARNKRSNRLLTAFGETKTMIEWSEDPRCKVNYQALNNRVNRGWTDYDSVTKCPNETRKSGGSHNEKMYAAFGESLLLRDWLNRYEVKRTTFHWRIKNGWSVEAALTGEKNIKISD